MSITLGTLKQYLDLNQKYLNLNQGDKIKFKWYGNSKLMYVGRIEVDKKFIVINFVKLNL